MAHNTLGEWSDGDDSWIFEVDENTLGEWSDGDDSWIFEVDENVLDDSEDGEIIFDVAENDQSAHNTLGEWSDGDDSWIFEVDENVLDDSEDGEIIRDVAENNQSGCGEKRKNNDDGDDDEEEKDFYIAENDQFDRGEKRKNNDDGDDEEEKDFHIAENDQSGRGEKRKINDNGDDDEEEKDFYVKESVKQINSKKFRMTAKDYTIRFNNIVSDLDLIESYQRTQAIFEHLLNDVTKEMNDRDQVRFVLRSEQLDTPISIPFIPAAQLTPERVFSQIERVVQSNRDFRLNDTVVIDIVHVEAPQGSGRSKRDVLNIKEFLHKKRSVITIKNNDDLCLARAPVVAIAKIEKDPIYKHLMDPERRTQEKKARELHELAKVPLGPCGLPEVELFQKYLTSMK